MTFLYFTLIFLAFCLMVSVALTHSFYLELTIQREVVEKLRKKYERLLYRQDLIDDALEVFGEVDVENLDPGEDGENDKVDRR